MNLRRYLLLFLIIAYFPANNSNAQWVQTTGSYGNSVTSFAGKNNTLFATTWGGGVFVSTDDGLSWNLKNNGLSTPYISEIIINNSDIFIGTSEGIFHSANDGDSWSLVNNNLKAVEAFAFMDTVFFAGDWYTGLLMSTDRGASWTPKNNGLTNLHITSINVLDSMIYTTTYGGGIFLSTDSGNNWKAMNSGLTNDTLGTFVNLDSYFFISSWGGGVFRSADQGNSWVESNNGLASLKVLSFAVDGNILFTSAYDGGVFSSSDFGQIWYSHNVGLTTLKVQKLFISRPYILVGTTGGKIFRRLLSEITTVKAVKNIERPSGFSLNQNYPNPFNPVTTIRYGLPKNTMVVLKIFNSFGQEIRILVNEFQSSGLKSVQWDGTDTYGKKVSSGIYIYSIQANRKTLSKKILLIR